MEVFFVIAGISFLVSIVSGAVGLGGAVILIPAYLYLPPLFGIESLDIKTISGLTSIQVFATSLLGVLVHHKRGSVNRKLLIYLGLPMMLSAFIGAILSGLLDSSFILASFAVMAAIGAVLMFMNSGKDSVELPAHQVIFNTKLSVVMAILVGIFGGMVGAPGAFLLAPIMITILKIPLRVTIGSTLGIVLFTALSASAGKIIAGQVDFLLTSFAVIGSIGGVILGSTLSYKIETKYLRLSLGIIIIGIALEMMYKLLV